MLNASRQDEVPVKMIEGKRHTLEGIQHLRGIAACMVVLSHVTAMARFPKYFGIDILNRFFETGATGVELFFVISGFIIAYTSLSPDLVPKLTQHEFFKKRFVRIVPLMWICIIGYAGLRYLGRGVFDPYPYLRALVLYPIGDVMPNIIWTLRHEALFYLVFCASWLAGRHWIYVMGAWFLSPLICFVLGIATPPLTWAGFFFNKLNLLFGFGFTIAVMHLKGMINPVFNFKTIYIPALVSGVVLLIYAHESQYVSDTYVRTVFDVLAIGVLCASIVILMLMFFEQSRLSYGNRVLLLLGNASYSIYLFHEFFISALLGVWSHYDRNAAAINILAGTTLIAVIGSILVYYLIETPLLAMLSRLKQPS